MGLWGFGGLLTRSCHGLCPARRRIDGFLTTRSDSGLLARVPVRVVTGAIVRVLVYLGFRV